MPKTETPEDQKEDLKKGMLDNSGMYTAGRPSPECRQHKERGQEQQLYGASHEDGEVANNDTHNGD